MTLHTLHTDKADRFELEANRLISCLPLGAKLCLDDLKYRDDIAQALQSSYQQGFEEASRRSLFSAGWHKGEMDFGVSCSVEDLTYEQMRSLREMIVVGIGQMEIMWSRRQAGQV